VNREMVGSFLVGIGITFVVVARGVRFDFGYLPCAVSSCWILKESGSGGWNVSRDSFFYCVGYELLNGIIVSSTPTAYHWIDY